MRAFLVLGLAGALLAGCAGKYEQLAKCSADENPVPALGFVPEPKITAAENALAGAVKDDCGPMRSVNNFQDDTWIPSATR
ncbi:hypothetical protein BS627_03545 [Agrobacterium salinitolerans]|uniref:hypothetical protein n=1 Tax=Agrobacterium salinitolerans TaxID=1183413 RepID=UPI0009902BE2|nr:hypothetical protein [Agrobacterium salinitolerans]OOO27798.1 hypothetical protein BS627_03545 [Agrobacterium salinitolerans]PNQ25699.1 hypothetical protein C2E26_03595 [Rhizobium sp. YIC5082]